MRPSGAAKWSKQPESVIFPQVCIPVVSVRLVKKHKTAGLVPNGLAITMDTGQKVQRHKDAPRDQQK